MSDRHSNLTAFSDDQLIEELLWRGYRIEGTIDAKGAGILMPKTAWGFRRHIMDAWGVKFPTGPIPERMLEYLLRRYPETAHWKLMADQVWYDDPNGGPLEAVKTLHVTLVRIRKCLEPTPYRIRTVWGLGIELYIIDPSET